MGQPTAAHSVLTDLAVFGDSLMVATAVRRLAEPGAAVWRTEDGLHFEPLIESAESEGFLRLRVLDGVLYAPDADPPGTRVGRIYRSLDGRTAELETIDATVHHFDVALVDGEIVASGASVGYRGVLHRRTESGWVRWLRLPARRAHFMRSHRGQLLVGMSEPDGSVDFVRVAPRSAARDSAAQESIARLNVVRGKPYTPRWFSTGAGDLYWSYRDRQNGRDHVAVSREAEGWRPVAGLQGRFVSDFAEYDGALYALAGRGLFVKRGEGPFTLVASAPAPSTFGPVRVDDRHRSLDCSGSLAVWRGELWCGSSNDGRLYRFVPGPSESDQSRR